MFEQLLAALLAIAAGLRDLNVNLAAQANGKPATAPPAAEPTKAPKSKPAATGAGAATQASTPATAATASISYQDLAAKFTALVEKDRARALELFAEFGCKARLTELKVEKYDDFSAAIDAAATPAEGGEDEGGLV